MLNAKKPQISVFMFFQIASLLSIQLSHTAYKWQMDIYNR